MNIVVVFSPIVPEILRAKASVFVELQQKTAEISELFVAAQESSRTKSEFLNMAAHELRTPLSVISGYLSLLVEGSLGAGPPSWQMPLEMLSAKAGELNRIVDDLLLASRMDVGSLFEHHAVFADVRLGIGFNLLVVTGPNTSANACRSATSTSAMATGWPRSTSEVTP